MNKGNHVHSMTMQDLVAASGKITKPEKVIDECLKAILIISRSGVDEFFRNKQAPDGTAWKPMARPRPDGSGVLLRDKGLLYNSIKAKILEGKVVLQASHPAAALHMYGGTIRPKLAKALSIPLTVEAKRKRSPRDMKGLFLLKGERHAYLAKQVKIKGKKGHYDLVLHWILLQKVDVPARPYLGWSAATIAKIQRIVADRMVASVAAPFAMRSAT